MKRMIFSLLLGSLSVASCEEKAHPAKFTVQVVDGEGAPVRQATVGTSTFVRWQAGQGFGEDIWEGPETRQTDDLGRVTFEHPSKRGAFGIGVDAGENFYRSDWPNYQFEKVLGGRWSPENPTITYVLKRKRNPIALKVKSLSDGLLVPVLGEQCGYDFEVGDWVAPHGKGKTTDIYFLVRYSKEENGDFDSSIEVSFPNPKDGMIYFEQERFKGSELSSDHEAPEEGYQPEKQLKRSQKDGKITTEINRQSGNYYLRLRTKLNEKGEIESAHYAKLYGDFMYFTYYFNPTTNDRNLEFDPKQNLLEGKGTKVSRP